MTTEATITQNKHRVPTTRMGIAKYRAVQNRMKELDDERLIIGGVECRLRFQDKMEILKREFFYSQDTAVIRVLNTELPPEEEEE
jgi:hypothetical protein